MGSLHTLFDSLFDGDIAIQKLKCLDPAALAALKEDYAKVFAPIISDITQHAIQNKAARQVEIAEINTCLQKAYAGLNAEQQKMTKSYLKHLILKIEKYKFVSLSLFVFVLFHKSHSIFCILFFENVGSQTIDI